MLELSKGAGQRIVGSTPGMDKIWEEFYSRGGFWTALEHCWGTVEQGTCSTNAYIGPCDELKTHLGVPQDGFKHPCSDPER